MRRIAASVVQDRVSCSYGRSGCCVGRNQSFTGWDPRGLDCALGVGHRTSEGLSGFMSGVGVSKGDCSYIPILQHRKQFAWVSGGTISGI